MLSLTGFQPLEESRKQLLLCQGERAFIFHLCDLSWSFACLIEVVGNDLRVWECSGLYNVGIELNNSRMLCLFGRIFTLRLRQLCCLVPEKDSCMASY